MVLSICLCDVCTSVHHPRLMLGNKTKKPHLAILGATVGASEPLRLMLFLFLIDNLVTCGQHYQRRYSHPHPSSSEPAAYPLRLPHLRHHNTLILMLILILILILMVIPNVSRFEPGLSTCRPPLSSRAAVPPALKFSSFLLSLLSL